METKAEWSKSDDDWNFPAENEDAQGWHGEDMDEPSTMTTQLPVVDGTPLTAFVDGEVAEAMEEAQPLWFGTRFSDISPELKQEAWVGLRRWVDQFVVQQNFTSELKPCWFQHHDVVNELYATMCADYKVWEEGAPSVGPLLSFQTYLPGLKQRLRESTIKFCTEDAHTWKEKKRLEYNETEWRSIRDSVSENVAVPRHKESKTTVRAVVGSDDSPITSSELVIGNLQQVDKLVPNLEVTDSSSPDSVTVTATFHRDDAVKWEHKITNDWVELVTED